VGLFLSKIVAIGRQLLAISVKKAHTANNESATNKTG
jgi:hypothetical protein